VPSLLCGVEMSKSVSKEIKEYRVSSVLNNDRKQFGKKYLFDGNEETCWNSDRGSPQWIEFSFPSTKQVTQLVIQFQGGFASKACVLEAFPDNSEDNNDTCDNNTNTNDDTNNTKKAELHPKDTNTIQTFQIDNLIASTKFKITFLTSYDFYGRIIIYHMDVIGD